MAVETAKNDFQTIKFHDCWRQLHTNPPTDGQQLRDWISSLPTSDAKIHAGQVLAEVPLTFPCSEQQSFKWTVDFHNKVNEDIDKPTIPFEQAKEIWDNYKNNMMLIKRDGRIVDFDENKIRIAISKAFNYVEANVENKQEIEKVVTKSVNIVRQRWEKTSKNPSVEEIQDEVEKALMETGHFDIAKAYIIYRNEHAKARVRDLFKPRVNLRPREYPELEGYVDSIRNSYWIHTEYNYTSDVQDFKVNTSDVEKEAIKNSMLAIAQIEVSVKAFWGNIYKHLPKPEIAAVGYTFSESEVRHADAYAHLLRILSLEKEFENLSTVPAIGERIDYLGQAVDTASSNDPKEYLLSVLLFSLFVENVSLFSQFLVIMSFNKYKNIFKGIVNAIDATSKEEQIHGMFGAHIINLAKEEHPEWFDKRLEQKITDLCHKSYEAESKIVDWITQKGELDFLPTKVIKSFIQYRLNNSLQDIGMPKIFTPDLQDIEEISWFDDLMIGTTHKDFFASRSVNYNKRSGSITGDDLF